MKISEMKYIKTFEEFDKDGNRQGLVVTSRFAYFMRIMTPKQLRTVSRACFLFMKGEDIPEMPQLESFVFLDILMDSGYVELDKI